MSLYSLTVKQAQQDLQQKKISSQELTQSCLERIEKLDKKIKAYLSLNNDALKEAKEADKLIGRRAAQKPLLGIPVAVKDNVCTKGLRTTAASKVLEDYIPVYDATIIQRLKAAGAIIIGKTNLDAWAHGSSTEASDFFTTRNPYDLSRLPGGSSGGSAAAVAADLTITSIGTETAGSIRQPASWCGACGLKPTYGRVSRYGIISMGSSLDSPGPIAKTVEDAAIILNTIAGFDKMDATSSHFSVEDYCHNLKKGIKGIKIGLCPKYLAVADKKIAAAIEKAAQILEKRGAKLLRVNLLDPQFSIAVYTILQRAEVATNLARFDGLRYGRDRTAFGEEAKRRIMLGTYALSAGFYDALYLKAQKVRTLIVSDFKKVFETVDLIIGPTTPCTALPLGSSQSSPMFGEVQDVLVEPSTIAGLPGISIPCGFLDGLPVGLQIIGRQFSESLILQAAHCYEQEAQWFKIKPRL